VPFVALPKLIVFVPTKPPPDNGSTSNSVLSCKSNPLPPVTAGSSHVVTFISSIFKMAVESLLPSCKEFSSIKGTNTGLLGVTGGVGGVGLF
jgi:hypothetical protein